MTDSTPPQFPPFAVTVDLVVLAVAASTVQVLLVRREVEPFPGRWSLPGGFVGIEQDLEDAARSKLDEKTGVALARTHFEQLATFGRPDRDPRMRTVSVVYLALVPELFEPVVAAGAPPAAWTDIASPGARSLAFDHDEILAAGVARLAAKLEYTTLATALCAATFTIAALRSVYETVWGVELDPANFHRKVMATNGFVEPTGEQLVAGAGRPAKVYRPGPAVLLNPPLQRPTEYA